MKKDKYPKMVKTGNLLYVSQEQLDGTSDFIIERWAIGDWRVKWRTSAHWGHPYKTKAEAFASVAEATEQ